MTEDTATQGLLGRARDLLGAPALQAEDDLIAHGLDSLGAMVLAAEAARAGLSGVSAAKVIAARTVARLAAAPSPVPVTTSGEASGIAPAQLAIWLDDQLRDDGDVANVLLARFRFEGPVEADRLAEALGAVVEHQPTLRTALAPDAWGRPEPEEVDLDEAVAIEVAGIAPDQVEEHWRALAVEVDVEEGPLLVACVVEGAPVELLLAVHHCVLDGSGLAVLCDQVSRAYEGRDLPEVASYAAYAGRAHARAEQALADDAGAWIAELATVPELEWGQTEPGEGAGEVRLALSAATADGLTRSAREQAVTPFSLVLAGFAAAVGEAAGAARIAVGVPMSGQEPDLSATVGCFVAVTPVVVETSGDLEQVCRTTQAAVTRSMAFREVGLGRVASEVRAARGGGGQVVQVQLSWPDYAATRWDLGGVEVTEVPPPVLDAQFDLTLELRPRVGDEPWEAVIEHDRSVVDEATARRVAEAFARWASAVGGD